MRAITLLWLLIGLTLTTGVAAQETKTSPVPPEIQKAQNEVWDLQYQLYQAQHDLAIAQITQNEAGLTLQKNGNPGAYGAQYTDLMSKLALERSKIEQRYSLAQQWYSDVQHGDIETANTIQQEMNQF